MEFRQLQYFLSIVDTGSFSAAADEYYISQSSISKMIISLEKELGVLLFDRGRRRVSLTEAGSVFLEHARLLVTEYKSMLVKLDGYKSGSDSFSVAAIPVLPQYGIASTVAAFRDRYPQIHFNLEETDGFNIIPGLLENRFDLAFARSNYLDRHKLNFVVINKDKLLLIVSKKSRYSDRSSISLKELNHDNFIVFDQVTDLHRLTLAECKKAGFEPTIFYSSHRKVSVFSLVETNIGLALMPAKIYAYHSHPDIRAIPLQENIECNIALVNLKNKPLPKAAELFMEFILQSSSN